MKIGQAVSVSNPHGDNFTGAIVSVYNNQVVVELFPDSKKAFYEIYTSLELISRLRFTKRSDGSYRLTGSKVIKLHY